MTSTVSFIDTQHGDMIHDIKGDGDYHAKRLPTSCLPRALMMFHFSFIGKSFLKILGLDSVNIAFMILHEFCNSIAWLLLHEYVACASSDGTVCLWF